MPFVMCKEFSYRLYEKCFQQTELHSLHITNASHLKKKKLSLFWAKAMQTFLNILLVTIFECIVPLWLSGWIRTQ